MFKLTNFVIFALMIMCGTGFAQDNHYWTNQYGTKSHLLGGAVVGKVLDLSSTYYNPGWLAFSKKTEVLQAASVYNYPTVTLKDINGRSDKELASSAFSQAPSLFAVSLNFKWLKNHKLAISIISRHGIQLDNYGTEVDTYDWISNFPGEEDVYLNLQLRENLSDVWYGLTWAFKLSDKVAIGFTPYISSRTHSTNYQTITEALTTGGDFAFSLESREYDYWIVRALVKAGLALDFGKLALGLTITTPSVKITGKGTKGVNNTLVGQDVTGSGVNQTFFASDYQENVPANYITPFSVGIGFNYRLKNSSIFFSAEYFSRVGKYDVLETEPTVIQSTGAPVHYKTTHEMDHVFNFAIGLEHKFGKSFSGYLAFYTDKSAKKKDSDTNLTITDWDIYSIIAGTIFTFKRYNFTLGLGYSLGDKDWTRTADSSPSFLGEIREVTFKYSSLKMILGFSF